MKHQIFKTLFAVVAATITFCVEADTHTETVNGIEWTYAVEDGEASIGHGYSNRAIPESTSGAITIPSTLGGCPVTTIGREAFHGCKSLTSVTIPDSVTSIGDEAFRNCNDRLYDLKTIPGVKLVDGWAIECEKTQSGYLNLAGVRGIASKAFHGCKSLTSVTIPDSVTSIGKEAFEYCSSLTGITIPNSVTVIGYEAFAGCSSLTSITIPNSVKSIGYSAFGGCESLTSVMIPNSVKSIGSYAFPNCKLITPVGNGDKVDMMVKGIDIVEEALTEQKKAELYDSFQTLFGKRIGDAISPYEIERSFYKKGKFHMEYVFLPRKPFLSFKHYIVKVSAQNHVIYSIRAIADYSPELYKMVKDVIEKKYQVWLHRWPSYGYVIENRYVSGVKGSLERLFNLQVVNKGYSGKEIVLEILDKQGEKIAEKESLGDAVDAL